MSHEIAKIAGLPPQQAKVGLAGDLGIAKIGGLQSQGIAVMAVIADIPGLVRIAHDWQMMSRL